MLRPLQEQIAEIIAALPEAEGFALAGGAALILRGEVERATRDLDIFGPSRDAVDQIVPAAVAVLRAAGLTVEVEQHTPGYGKLAISDPQGGEVERIDFGLDTRLFPAERRHPITVLSGQELAVDKVLAIFGRTEPRDFLDLAAIAPRYEFDRLLDHAREKDRGFTPAMFAEMLERFHRLDRSEFDIADGDYDQVSGHVERWRTRALELAAPARELPELDLDI